MYFYTFNIYDFLFKIDDNFIKIQLTDLFAISDFSPRKVIEINIVESI